MREIERLLAKDGVVSEVNEDLVNRLCYILRAQGGEMGAELAGALLAEVEEAPPEG